MKARPEDRLLGVWRHPVGGWEIKYQKDGKRHSEYRKDETEARLRGDYWKSILESPQEDSKQEHPVHYWERKLREAAELAMKNPGDKNVSDTCKAVAAAATAALRTAKYIAPPTMEQAPDGAPVIGDISNLTSDQLKEMLKS